MLFIVIIVFLYFVIIIIYCYLLLFILITNCYKINNV